MKKYLISGISPSFGGVGYLMYNLEKLATDSDYTSIYPRYKNKNIKKDITNPLFILKELSNRFLSKFTFNKSLKKIKNSEVILIHPQTIGYENFFELVKNNTQVKVYVMDNSFFCINSYNVLDNKECFKCLNNINNCDIRCESFPVKINKDSNQNYLKEYKHYSNKIKFYAQNRSQALLLQKHFGIDTDITVIGMKTGETFHLNTKQTTQYDIVFHGSNVEAKGIDYMIELAKILPQYSFFIPSHLQINNLPQNITHQNISWSTGLEDLVINARLVMNPSIWSAPVEGALLKSVYYNGNVGVVDTEFGFVNDISDENLLKLSSDVKKAKLQIEQFFDNKTDLKGNSQKWLANYLEHECNLELLFQDAQ